MVNPAINLSITQDQLHQAYVDLKAAEGSLQVDLRRGLNAAAAPLVAAVKAEASWSTRIPSAVKAKTSFSARSAGVSITVNSKAAPEAGPIDNGGKAGTFSHPVYAKGPRASWTWRDQTSRPFFWAGIAAADKNVDAAMLAVLDALAKRAGFK